MHSKSERLELSSCRIGSACLWLEREADGSLMIAVDVNGQVVTGLAWARNKVEGTVEGTRRVY